MKVYNFLSFLVVFLLCAFAKADTTSNSFDKECIYVIAKGGLNMRDTAGSTGRVIDRLPYGTKLDWTPPGIRDVKTYVMDNGKKVEGYWVKVWRSVPFEELKGNLGGYVFSAYLDYHLKEIPERSLYFFKDFSYIDSNYENLYSAHYQINEETYNYSAYIDCYPRYEQHVGRLYIDDKLELIYRDNATAFLKSKINLQLVNLEEVIDKKKVTAYEIDYSNKPKYVYTEGNAKDGGWFKFDLSLKNGSVKTIEAWRGECSYNHQYVGKIEKLNLYLLSEDCEGINYFGIDRTTGERKEVSVNISNDGSYAVRHLNHFLGYNAQLQIKYLNRDLTSHHFLNIEFQSWAIDEDLSSSFWISNNELILKVHPIDSSVMGTYYDDRKKGHSWQYLKLTIL